MCVCERVREKGREIRREIEEEIEAERERYKHIYIEREINRQRERKKEIVRWIDGIVDMFSVKGKKMYEKIQTSSHTYIMITNGWNDKFYMSVY